MHYVIYAFSLYTKINRHFGLLHCVCMCVRAYKPVMNIIVGIMLTVETAVLREKHVPVPLCPPQIPHGLA